MQFCWSIRKRTLGSSRCPDYIVGISHVQIIFLGLGGCTSYDIVSILKKTRQSVEDCKVSVDADRAEEPQRVLTGIRIHYTVSSYELNENQVHRALNCPEPHFGELRV